jgi:hypothetical protein
MQNKIEAYKTARSSIANQCKNPVPNSLDTFEDLKYNGEASLSGTFSLSQSNNKIEIGSFGADNSRYYSCLAQSSKSNLRVYVEYLEESYTNTRIPVQIIETQGDSSKVIAESESAYLPALNQKFLRGEFMQTDFRLDQSDGQVKSRNIVFNVEEILDSGNGPTGCVEVYVEVSLVPHTQISFDDEKCKSDHDNPVIDEIFGNSDVLKIKPGFDYSSVADVSTHKFKDKSYVYKTDDPVFFHQKDIELVDSTVQNLDIEIWQNFQTSSHMLGLIIEAPLDGNHENFMHGETEPDCTKNECVFSDKTFNGQYISYVFNSNIASRVRLWFYKLITLPKSELSKDCTPYHFTIKSTKNYIETSSKEKVACLSETFPSKITSRRFAHREQEGAYILDDNYRMDSFSDISFSEDKDAQRHFSTMILDKESLVKVILRKEVHILGYSIVFYKVNDNSEDIVYSTSTKRDSASNFGKDTRVSIVLPQGQYKVRIHAQMSDMNFMYKTCDSIRVYFGITPTSSLDIPSKMDAATSLPDLAFLLSTNETMYAKLPEKSPGDSKVILNTTLNYKGNSGDIGLFIEVGENLDASLSEEISEITASIYPNIETKSMKSKKGLVIATSGGMTHLHLPKLESGTEYRLILEQEAIVSKGSSVKVPSNVAVNAYLFSASQDSSVRNAKVEVNGRLVSIPIQDYLPS